MKKNFMLLLVVIFVLSMLPISVFAAEKAELDVRVYNRTGDAVSLRLTGADGVPMFYDLPAEESILTLIEGKYEYYAVTSCGTQVGNWNVNVVKELLLKCEGDTPAISLTRACPDNLYGHYWYGTAQNQQTWTFVAFDIINVPDNSPTDITWQDGGIDCWSNIDEHWPAWILDLIRLTW